jgi:hypothetical protein
MDAQTGCDNVKRAKVPVLRIKNLSIYFEKIISFVNLVKKMGPGLGPHFL